jgi:hypothetical protein
MMGVNTRNTLELRSGGRGEWERIVGWKGVWKNFGMGIWLNGIGRSLPKILDLKRNRGGVPGIEVLNQCGLDTEVRPVLRLGIGLRNPIRFSRRAPEENCYARVDYEEYNAAKLNYRFPLRKSWEAYFIFCWGIARSGYGWLNFRSFD